MSDIDETVAETRTLVLVLLPADPDMIEAIDAAVRRHRPGATGGDIGGVFGWWMPEALEEDVSEQPD